MTDPDFTANAFGHAGILLFFGSVTVAIARILGYIAAWTEFAVPVIAGLGLGLFATIGTPPADGSVEFLPEWAGMLGTINVTTGLGLYLISPVIQLPFSWVILAAFVLFTFGMLLFMAAEEAHEQLEQHTNEGGSEVIDP